MNILNFIWEISQARDMLAKLNIHTELNTTLAFHGSFAQMKHIKDQNQVILSKRFLILRISQRFLVQFALIPAIQANFIFDLIPWP